MQQHLPWTPPVEAVHQRVKLCLGGDHTQTVTLRRLNKHSVRKRLQAAHIRRAETDKQDMLSAQN
jgi:hypothetical protein